MAYYYVEAPGDVWCYDVGEKIALACGAYIYACCDGCSLCHNAKKILWGSSSRQKMSCGIRTAVDKLSNVRGGIEDDVSNLR